MVLTGAEGQLASPGGRWRTMPHAALDGFLRALADHEGSDLHVKPGSPPRIRVNGSLRTLPGEPVLEAMTTAEMAEAILRPDVAEAFATRNEADFAYSVDGVGRFRVNAFRQRGTVAM